jgi:selenocysteine lyase/cysteine desulfurase
MQQRVDVSANILVDHLESQDVKALRLVSVSTVSDISGCSHLLRECVDVAAPWDERVRWDTGDNSEGRKIEVV